MPRGSTSGPSRRSLSSRATSRLFKNSARYSRAPVTDMRRPLRIGVNALYLIPGGVGGTEIYLRALLTALAKIDPLNQYFVFTNRETGADLVPKASNFIAAPQPVRAVSRP